MANRVINQFPPAATPPLGTDILPISRDGVRTNQIAYADLVTPLAVLAAKNVFSGGSQSVSPVTQSVTGDVLVDASTSNNFRYLLTGNVTIKNPTGLVDGQILNMMFIQDDVGGHTVTFDIMFKFIFKVPPTATTAAGGLDFASCYYDAALNIIICNYTTNYG